MAKCFTNADEFSFQNKKIFSVTRCGAQWLQPRWLDFDSRYSSKHKTMAAVFDWQNSTIKANYSDKMNKIAEKSPKYRLA
jgi:DNA-binding PadR family transcriptional regulator